MDDRVANRFLLQGIQDWGQTAEVRENAVRDYVAAAGLEFGSTEANEWLINVLRDLRRGEFSDEIRQLKAALDARTAASSTAK